MGLRSFGNRTRRIRLGSAAESGILGNWGFLFFVIAVLLVSTLSHVADVELPHSSGGLATDIDNDDSLLPEEFSEGGEEEPSEGIPTKYQDFSLGVLPSTVVPHLVSSTEAVIETDEYNLTVDWSQPGWVDYKVGPDFTTDFIRYRRANPTHPEKGTIDEFGNPLNDVNMTITSWGLQENVGWFVESCQEFSLNQTFRFFRDYIELNVTYTPGTKNALTTYFIALFSDLDNTYDMFDGGYHRYMPGTDEELPWTNGMGGWYPRYQMYAPAMDMRVPYGDMGVEWGYNDTVAYLLSPMWIEDYKGGASAFSVKYTSLNSVVPNIGLGTPETFHMFIRPYQYSDGKDRGNDVGYAQWVTEKIVDEWGYHDTSVFPLTVMNYGTWKSEFSSWVESSQVKVATYSQNPYQINYNYGSAWQRNRAPTNDPSLIPDDWELWGPGNKPEFAGDGDVILNPVSGTYEDVGSFRHHLIEDNPYNDWWWGSDAVFWDEMNVYTPDVRPRNDYHNRSEFVYEGYINLIKETIESGHWTFAIANPYTALIHLSAVSDLTVIESYRSSSFFGPSFVEHTHSTMMFVNNIPEQYRPNILVYQYYDAVDNPDDQEDVYRFLFGSAGYKYHTALVSWSNQSYQIHNLEMAEKMYLAMGASRDKDIQIQAGTLDLDLTDTLSTSSRSIVWTGDVYSPTIRLTNEERSYNFTNLRGDSTDFVLSIDTNSYYRPQSSLIRGRMTYSDDGSAWFNGVIEAEETDYLQRIDDFQVRHSLSGEASVELLDLSKTEAKFHLASSTGETEFTIGSLLPGEEYAVYLDGFKHDVFGANASGSVTFTLSSQGNQTVHLVLDTEAPFTDLTLGPPYYVNGDSTYVTSSTYFTLIPYSSNGKAISSTEYRIWSSGQWSNWYTYSDPFSVTGLDGDRFIEYYSTDKGGGIEFIKNFTCTLDNTPPGSSISVGHPRFGSNPVFVSGKTSISLDAVDGGSGLLASWYEIDSEPASQYLAPFNLSAYQGLHLLRFGGIDNIGNNESPQEIWVFVDDQPPTSTIHIGEPSSLQDGIVYVSSSTEFNITITDEGSGSDRAWYKIDDGDWIAFDGNFSIQDEGFHNVFWNSTDNVSNPEATNSIDVFVDNTPPIASAPLDLEVERGSAFTLNAGSSTDNALIVNYTWSSDDFLLYGVSPSHTISRIGSYLLVLTVIDIMGHEDTDTLWVNVSDTTPPSPPTGLRAEPGRRGEIELAWDTNLEDDIAGYFVYRSASLEGPFTKITAEIVPHAHYMDTGLPDGKTFYYVVTAVDASGNECTYSSEGVSTTITPHSGGFMEDWWWVIVFLIGVMTFVPTVFLIRRRKEKARTESSRKRD